MLGTPHRSPAAICHAGHIFSVACHHGLAVRAEIMHVIGVGTIASHLAMGWLASLSTIVTIHRSHEAFWLTPAPQTQNHYAFPA